MTGVPSPLSVGLVVHSLEDNNIGRVFPFLRAFSDRTLVDYRLVGWRRGRRLFPLIEDEAPRIRTLHGSHVGRRAERELKLALEGCELIHCFKPRRHFVTAATVAGDLGIPLLLDVDDWEAAVDSTARTWRSQLTSVVRQLRSTGDDSTLDRLARTGASGVTVNSTALRSRYGGRLLYTAADPREFDVEAASGLEFRVRHAIPLDAKVIGFLGTPHPYKGFDDLLAAFAILRATDPQIRLLVAGVPQHNRYRRRLNAIRGATTLDYLSPSDYPDAYAACDVIAIPQRAVGNGSFQTPAKLILAMAASRAIVATPVGDISAILGDAGVFVPAEAPEELARAIEMLMSDADKRTRLGTAARMRFLARFGLDRLRSETLAAYRVALANSVRRPDAVA